jgi:hypothetical protein
MFKTILLSALLFAASETRVSAQAMDSVLGAQADPRDVSREPVRWPAPEAVAQDLRSSHDETRIKALKLMGFSDEQIHLPVWSQGNDARVTGTKIVMPD